MASNEALFGLFAGDLSTATLRGPDTLFPRLLPPVMVGDNCGIILDRLRGLSIRIGPMFDLLRPFLLELRPTTFGDIGNRFVGLGCVARPLGTLSVLMFPPPLLEELPVGEEERFMLRSVNGDFRLGDPWLIARSSSSSARLPKVEARDRDLKNPRLR